MNAASQVPSGVLISTSVSTISIPMSAAAVDDTDAAMPAPTKRAAKSRRVRSPGCALFVGWFFSSSVIVFLAKSLSQLASRWHRQINRALGVARSLAFLARCGLLVLQFVILSGVEEPLPPSRTARTRQGVLTCPVW